MRTHGGKNWWECGKNGVKARIGRNGVKHGIRMGQEWGKRGYEWVRIGKNRYE